MSVVTETENSLLDALPGVAMPVAEVEPTLARIWSAEGGKGVTPPSEYRASQMNLILHFGLKTSADEARERFDAAIRFAQRYPCRIIALCPAGRERSERQLQGKLFTQCYIGPDLRSMCCCEAIGLGYPTREAGFLDNQVSIWLENDLPTCHWFNRVPARRIEDIHFSFIKNCRRVVYDSAVEDEDFTQIAWPHPEAVRDLAWARLLPVRQSLGQFLSSFQPSELAGGLANVRVQHEGMPAEARWLLHWQRTALENCAAHADLKLEAEFHLDENPRDLGHCLETEWTYRKGDKFFRWSHCSGSSDATFEANITGRPVSLPLSVPWNSPEDVLAEALFF